MAQITLTRTAWAIYDVATDEYELTRSAALAHRQGPARDTAERHLRMARQLLSRAYNAATPEGNGGENFRRKTATARRVIGMAYNALDGDTS